MLARPLVAALALAAAAPASAGNLRLTPSLGVATIERGGAGDRTYGTGVALQLRLDGQAAAPRLGYGVTFTWGLTDWDRAREWIDAGNRAGGWTTDKLADVEAWVRRGQGDDTEGLRILAAAFADMFLVMTYSAVPFCYVGSVGGATSHLQLDLTGTFHLAEAGAQNDAWLEVGLGAAALPERTLGPDSRFVGFRRGAGPVVGVGARFGGLQLSARLLASPPAGSTSSYGGPVIAGSMTVGFAR